jgi:RNA polymerase sigma-70 factor, ECF subfamily
VRSVAGVAFDDGIDRELVRRVRRGSRDAAAELFDRHWRALWRAAVAVTGSEALAEDAVQDGFVRAFAALPTYDARRPFAPWLRRIVVNRALDVWREERRRAPLEEDALPVAAGVDDDQRELAAAVARLAPERRAVIVLHHLLGFEVSETAELLGVPRGTVASRLHRGLADLRALLEEVPHAD